MGRTIEGVLADVDGAGRDLHRQPPGARPRRELHRLRVEHPDTPWDKVAGIEIITGNGDRRARCSRRARSSLGRRSSPPATGSPRSAAATITAPAWRPASPTRRSAARRRSCSPTSFRGRDHRGDQGRRTIVKLRGPDDPFVEVTIAAPTARAPRSATTSPALARVELAVHVTGGAGHFLQLWRDGEKLDQVGPPADDFRPRFTDAPGREAPLPRRADQRRQPPRRRDQPLLRHGIAAAAEGCCNSSPAAGSPLALAVLGLVLRRRRASR